MGQTNKIIGNLKRAARVVTILGRDINSDFRPNRCKRSGECKSAIIRCVGEDLDEEAQPGQV